MERAARLALLTRRGSLTALLALAGSLSSPVLGGGYAAAQALTQDEVLRAAFPAAERIERRTAFLEEEELASAAGLAGGDVEVESGLITYYMAMEKGAPAGVAYFDSHRVRTLPEVLMVIVDPEDRIRRIEVVRWAEPPEFRPPLGWLTQFLGRVLDDDLSARRGIAGITGATLTTRAVTGAARRILALHLVIAPFETGAR